jgi:hypothetical protein
VAISVNLIPGMIANSLAAKYLRRIRENLEMYRIPFFIALTKPAQSRSRLGNKDCVWVMLLYTVSSFSEKILPFIYGTAIGYILHVYLNLHTRESK